MKNGYRKKIIMQKGSIFLICFLVLNNMALYTQNLVPNPSFESYNNCPDDISQIHRTVNWDSPENHEGTADYFNSCDKAAFIGVPKNIFGTSIAYDGKGYAGFYTYFLRGGQNMEYREYIQTSLNTTMIANKIYCISFRVKRANHDPELPISSTNNIGMYISINPIKLPSAAPNGFPLKWYGYKPQIEEKQIISGSNSWTLISGTYLAKGGEKNIAIGNFSDDNSTLISGSKYSASYYYIDSININLCETTCHVEFEIPDTICVNDCFYPENNTTVSFAGNTSTDTLHWSWDLTGGIPFFSDLKNPGEICYYKNGVYPITLIAFEGSKSDTIRKNITVVPDCIKSAFYVPNSFTPNNDGINDLFMPKGAGIDQIVFVVFNRWGQKVFESSNLSLGWDGTFNGHRCEQNIYVWKITIVDNYGVQKDFLGRVNLIR